MKIKIINPGLLATVQDLGRPEWRSNGVPPGGAADTTSHRLANFCVGNEAGAATLEIAGGKFTARTEQGGWLAAGGAEGQFLIDQREMGFGRLVFAPKGAVLNIRPGAVSNYAYLAVPGGWDVPEVLDSKSTCVAAGFGGFQGRGLQKGDVLNALYSSADLESSDELNAEKIWASKWFAGGSNFGLRDTAVIRVLPGPEVHWWSDAQQEQFFKTPFVISTQRDRMGVRLDADPGNSGMPTLVSSGIMLSTAVCPGVIQVPPDGSPVVLLADAQTTGGYPRIAQVIAVDIPLMAQTPAGQIVYFQIVTLEEAERLFFEQENILQKIQLALRWTLQRRTIQ